MQNKKIAAGLSIGLACCAPVMGQSSDALLDKLVEKGVLSVKEANTLREETDKDFNKAYSIKSGMPDWVSSLKINGDLRGRFDEIKIDNGSQAASVQDRDRFRYRARLGATATMFDDMEVGLRLCSGDDYSKNNNYDFGGSQFSGNTTMNNDASRKFVFLDLAYAKYTPAKWVELQFGKMLNQFWVSPMIVSPDYNPEGAQEKFSFALDDKNTLNFTGGEWVINENNPGRDVYMFAGQVDWTAKWTKSISSRLGVMTYSFLNPSATTANVEAFVANSNNGTPLAGTSVQANPNLTYGAQNINPIIGRAEVTYNLESFPLYTGGFPVTASGEYANNPAANGKIHLANGSYTAQPYSGLQNEAFSLGVTFGNSKAKGNWQVGYTYKNIETASLWRGLMDDNFGYGGKGGTDVRGHLVSASYRVFTPFLVQFQYFITEPINQTAKYQGESDRMLVDLIWSF